MPIDLSKKTRSPYVHRETLSGTTWTEILLPTWVTKIVMRVTGDVKLGLDQGEGGERPSDGGTVGTHFFTFQTAVTPPYYELTITDPEGRPHVVGHLVNRSLFVAPVAAGTVIELLLLHGRL